MLNRFGHVLLIVAVLSATGAHWLMLQSVAWSTMLASNLRTTTLSEAMEKTFNGKNPCCLCKEITKGKQEEKQSKFRSDSKGLEFAFAAFQFVFTPPSFSWEPRVPEQSAALRNHAPPSPPPKRLHG